MNKISIITGGGSGIGRSLALYLANQNKDVLIIGRNLQELIDTSNRFPSNIFIVEGDINSDDTIKLIKEFLSRNKYHVEHLVHCAAEAGPIKQLKDINRHEWRSVIGSNLEAPIFLTAGLFDNFTKNARILFIGSSWARFPQDEIGTYCISKAALYMAYEVLKKENSNLLFGSINPGLVDSKIIKQILNNHSENFSAAKFLKKIQNENSFSSPKLVAEYIYWILTESNNEDFTSEEWSLTEPTHNHLHDDDCKNSNCDEHHNHKYNENDDDELDYENFITKRFN